MKGWRDRDIMYTRAGQNNDLIPFHVGHEQCKAEQCWGPGIRDYFLVHYIRQGKGTFEANGKQYHLHAGQMFFIFPENISCYRADPEEPWEYYWIIFGGSRASQYLKEAGITQQRPIFALNNPIQALELFTEMLQTYDNNLAHKLRLTALLYTFVSKLIEEGSASKTHAGNTEQYFQYALSYIRQNYSHNITVDDLAGYIGISRKHLYRIFKNSCNISPKKYILRFQMDKASELLGNEDLSVSSIAFSVGYKDPLMFSKIFKKYYGKSPNRYRREKDTDISTREEGSPGGSDKNL